MRSKIRARASQEGIEKSVATKKAIEEATIRAMSGQSSATPDQMLDLSGFGEKFVDDGTDELTEEEKAEIDKIANMPILEQIREELANTRFPTPMAIFQTACVMALIFAASATLILKGDATIRDIYMDFGFIPRPDEVYDFSDLELPSGFLEQQDLESDIGAAFKSAVDIADQILPSSSPWEAWERMVYECNRGSMVGISLWFGRQWAIGRKAIVIVHDVWSIHPTTNTIKIISHQ